MVPQGTGGNGLILHSCLAVNPDCGQPLGLLWEKLWHREKKVSPPDGETPTQKKKRLKKERNAKRKLDFKSKESYRWVEAFAKIEKLFSSEKMPIGEESTRIIHVFDREGDIAEVFAEVRKRKK